MVSEDFGEYNMTIKTSGFNIQDIDQNKSDIGSIIDIEQPNMERELKLKKKKFNFDKIFPVPKVDKCMGLCDIKSGHNPFKELFR